MTNIFILSRAYVFSFYLNFITNSRVSFLSLRRTFTKIVIIRNILFVSISSTRIARRAIVGIVINVGNVGLPFFFRPCATQIAHLHPLNNHQYWFMNTKNWRISRVTIRAGASSSFSVRAIAW